MKISQHCTNSITNSLYVLICSDEIGSKHFLKYIFVLDVKLNCRKGHDGEDKNDSASSWARMFSSNVHIRLPSLNWTTAEKQRQQVCP